jgi:putative colanic acid biosynthesis UDP-glucose lipid carrier transferase
MVNRYFFLLRFMLAVTDFILINLCFFLGYYLANKYYEPIDAVVYKDSLLISNLIWFVSVSLIGLYLPEKIISVKYIYQTTISCLLLHFMFFASYLFLVGYYSFPIHFIVSFYSLTIFGFVLSRFTGTTFQNRLTSMPELKKSVGIFDMNEGGIKLAGYLNSQSTLNFRGFINSDKGSAGALMSAQDFSISQSFKKAVQAGIHELYVCMDPRRIVEIQNLVSEGEKHCVRVKVVPDFIGLEANFSFEETGDFMMLSPRYEPLQSLTNRFRKRLFDIIVSSLVIVLILSWLYPVLALIIKLQSRGPVIFKQLRSGRDNAPFWCYKFRSMTVNNHSPDKQAVKGDSRITSIGHFLRKSSLDEFPQFFNVLMGDMSIIGPRPHMISHTEHYSSLIESYMTRQFLKPGISGWAQVNGYRGETRDTRLMEARVEHDIWYLSNWTMVLDVKILLMTVQNMFKGEENAF